MRILTKPEVTLVAGTQINEDGIEFFLLQNGLEWPTPTRHVSPASRLVELAGRCCYMSFGAKAGSKTNQGYVNNLLGRKESGEFMPGPAHGSVLEHASWSFVVTGAGRGFSHEQVRHRVGVAYSQLSTRYCDFEREDEEGTWDPGFCIPPLAQLSTDAIRLFEEKYASDVEYYKRAVDIIMEDIGAHPDFEATLADMPKRDRARAVRKAARGAARDLLPIGTEAIMTMTFNARAIWNMAYLRANGHAEGVIREVFCQIVELMEDEFPELFNGIVYEKVWDGSRAVVLPRSSL